MCVWVCVCCVCVFVYVCPCVTVIAWASRGACPSVHIHICSHVYVCTCVLARTLSVSQSLIGLDLIAVNQTNWARKGFATQSSTLQIATIANKAIDEKFGIYMFSDECSCTVKSYAPWWKIYFVHVLHLRVVLLTNAYGESTNKRHRPSFRGPCYSGISH